jgi:hypothetical protein
MKKYIEDHRIEGVIIYGEEKGFVKIRIKDFDKEHRYE